MAPIASATRIWDASSNTTITEGGKNGHYTEARAYDTQTYAALTHALVEQSYMLSSLDFFYVTSALSICIVVLVWMTRRPRIASGMAPAGE